MLPHHRPGSEKLLAADFIERGATFGARVIPLDQKCAPRDGLCSSSRRAAPSHDRWASIDSPARSVGATVVSPVPSDPRSRSARCEGHSVDTTRGVAHRRASRDARPRAHRPTCDPAPIARDPCVRRTRCRRTGVRRVARSES
jgi:hypothetical protein